MDKEEFLFLIPGVLYGIAVFDLLSLIRNKKIYWESAIWAILLFFTLLVTLFNLHPDLTAITEKIGFYTLFIFSPIFFVQSCYLINPSDPKSNMKQHFMSKRKMFFSSLTGFVFINLFVHMLVTNNLNIYRSIIGLVLFGVNIFIDKIYLRLFTAIVMATVIVISYAKLL